MLSTFGSMTASLSTFLSDVDLTVTVGDAKGQKERGGARTMVPLSTLALAMPVCRL